MGNIKNEFVQPQNKNEQSLTKVINDKSVLKRGTNSKMFERLNYLYLMIKEHTNNILDIDEIDLSNSEDNETERTIYLKEFYDINNEKEKISTIIFLENELNRLLIEYRNLQKQIEPLLPKRFSWEEDEDDFGNVRGDEEVIFSNINYNEDEIFEMGSEEINIDLDTISYNYFRVNESLSTQIEISFGELFDYFDGDYSSSIESVIESIIKSKI